MSSDLLDLKTSTRFRQFNWEKAKTLYYVAKLGSFTKAATFLRVNQSSLSRHVIELEQTLSTPLFTREARGVKLTRKGEELFAIIEAAFLGINGFTRNIHPETSQGKKRKIRIAATHAITSYILNKHILSYNKEHPDLMFELISDDHMIDIVVNDVDIAIRPFDSEARGVQQEHLFSLEKKLYASADYLEKYGEPQTVEELKDHHIIAPADTEAYPYSDLNWILRLGLSKGNLHEPIYRSTSLEALVQAAKEGMGIIASYEQMEIIKNSNFKNILPFIKGEIIEDYFIYPEHFQKDKEIIDLKNYLQTQFAK